jgi:hypothetical protein
MKTIYKYAFPTCNPNSVAMLYLPRDAEILRLDTEDGHAFLWAIVDTDKPNVARKFALHKTGSNMDSNFAWDTEQEVYNSYVGRFAIWAEMELMMYVFDLGEEW